MKKTLCVAAALLMTACASTRDDGPDLPPPAVAPAADPRIGELQTQMTELLERIDVLNQRIALLEEGAPAPAPAVATTTTAPAPSGPASATRPAAPQRQASAAPPSQRAVVGAQIAENYRQAVVLFGRGRTSEARQMFQNVFEADSGGELADNALFWIGETYFAAKDYTNAVRYYTRVVNDYSSQNKAPDALFKTAVVQARTGDLALARRTLQQVIERYPYSSSASSAKAELERIKF